MKQTLSFTALKAGLGIAETLGLRPKELQASWLKDKACQETGLTDFGDTYYQEGLDRVCSSANMDARLNAYGRLMLSNIIVNALVNRLLLQKTRVSQPELLETKLIPPIIITGLPRTGTTNLHRLIASDPDNRALEYWELVHPFARNPQDTEEARIARADKLLKIRRKLTPELDAIHYIRTDSAEECMFMMVLSMESRFFWNLASVHSYLDWYRDADRSNKYRDYRDMLFILQARQPDKRLVLKAPDHVDGMDALMEQLPEALVVQTHRDPVAQFASYLSLGEQTRIISTDHPQKAKDTELNILLTQSSISRFIAARENHPNRVFDVQYTDLIADPALVVQSVYDHFGLNFSTAQQEKLTAHSGKNRQHKHGQHDYSLDQYGLTPAKIEKLFHDPFLKT